MSKNILEEKFYGKHSNMTIDDFEQDNETFLARKNTFTVADPTVKLCKIIGLGPTLGEYGIRDCFSKIRSGDF